MCSFPPRPFISRRTRPSHRHAAEIRGHADRVAPEGGDGLFAVGGTGTFQSRLAARERRPPESQAVRASGLRPLNGAVRWNRTLVTHGLAWRCVRLGLVGEVLGRYVSVRSPSSTLSGSGLRCDWRGGEGHGSVTYGQGSCISPDFWHALVTRPARIIRPSPKCLVSGGHIATDGNASSVPDGMHTACHHRRAVGPPHPESPDTAAEAAPRGGRVSPAFIPPGRPAAPSPAPQQRATGVVMQACSPTRRINHRLVGPAPRGRGAPKSMLPSPSASDDLSSGRGSERSGPGRR